MRLRREIGWRIFVFDVASKREPYWHFMDTQGFKHIALFCLETVTRPKDGAVALVFTVGPFHMGFTIKRGTR